MANISLRDILIGARQEAYRMRHYYVGAEHLFIASLDIRGSLAGKIVQESGLTPEYVIDAIRRKIGKGGKARLWAGVPNTPRAEVILGIATDIALEDGREEANERDLLIGLFEERDSIPLRVLHALGLEDLAEMATRAQTLILDNDSQQPYIKIDFGAAFNPTDALNKDQLFLLRRMFYGYNKVHIERRLVGGYSKAVLLVVVPTHLDGREDSPVAIKINKVDRILDEAQRYETHVKSKLPMMTARIEEKPIAPETSDLAGIKYTLVADGDRIPRDLRAVFDLWDAQRLGDWLKHELYPTFGPIWWQQNRSYRFQVWREYDWLLPPILTLEHTKKSLPAKGHTLKMPIKRAKLRRLDYGDTVAVENFVVQRIYPERNTIQLAVTQGSNATRAYKIEVRGIDFSETTYYRGEVVEILVGSVWQTRNQVLTNALRMLEPDFDPTADKIKIDDDLYLPNPVKAYEGLLDSYVNGSLATVHGDLHPGNIMIGPKNSAFLIDFAHTRDGHTVFDWATLEISMLADYVTAKAGETWEDMRHVIRQVQRLNGGETFQDDKTPLGKALSVIAKIRQIAFQCLAQPDQWAEYYVALAFCSLRGLNWDTISVASRRLLTLNAGLAIYELSTRFRPTSTTDTPSPDDTEINTMF
jgi:hypothetical protein